MSNQSYIALDLETDGLDYRKDPIVAIGLKNGMIDKVFWESSKETIVGMVPSSIHILVGHNIKFDLLFLWSTERLQYMFQEGLRIWDTQLVEYMLSGQQNKYPKLRDIAVQKYGCSERMKHIENLLFERDRHWKQSHAGDFYRLQHYLTKEEVYNYKKVSDLPRQFVLEDVQNDVVDTEQVYLQQLQKVHELGKNFENLVMLEHDTLLATAEMTYNGMMASTQKLLENKEELEIQLGMKQLELRSIVGKYWR